MVALVHSHPFIQGQIVVADRHELVHLLLPLCLQLNARDELGGPLMHFLELLDVRIAN